MQGTVTHPDEKQRPGNRTTEPLSHGINRVGGISGDHLVQPPCQAVLRGRRGGTDGKTPLLPLLLVTLAFTSSILCKTWWGWKCSLFHPKQILFSVKKQPTTALNSDLQAQGLAGDAHRGCLSGRDVWRVPACFGLMHPPESIQPLFPNNLGDLQAEKQLINMLLW